MTKRDYLEKVKQGVKRLFLCVYLSKKNPSGALFLPPPSALRPFSTSLQCVLPILGLCFLKCHSFFPLPSFSHFSSSFSLFSLLNALTVEQLMMLLPLSAFPQFPPVFLSPPLLKRCASHCEGDLCALWKYREMSTDLLVQGCLSGADFRSPSSRLKMGCRRNGAGAQLCLCRFIHCFPAHLFPPQSKECFVV